VSTDPAVLDRPETVEDQATDRPWTTVVWNDPINLMSYVTYVFQSYFGYAKEKAEKLMLDVHHAGRATVSSGTRDGPPSSTDPSTESVITMPAPGTDR
jgi:ATP-dependent Clp protease adaptor protein ClpS